MVLKAFFCAFCCKAALLQVFLLLAEHLAQWSTNVAFPETSFITSYQLSQVRKPKGLVL